ncbi:MAG: hypothetical protein SWQ30_19170 [Thermodesulfobacteriota bacterium]|nr:hypothetical protein [Thermodesulfobacteriota bacterium]
MIGSYTHSELRETMREYTTEDDGFDFESVLDLVLAGIDNLGEHSTEDDFQGQNRLTEQQAEFLRHLFLRLMPEA